MRHILSFKTTLPESTEYDHPRGYSIAKFLYTELTKAQFDVQSPDNYDDFAWSVDCKINENKVFFFVGYLGTKVTDWQLIICSNFGLIDRLFRRNNEEDRTKLAKAIHSILSNDARFSDFKWFSKYTDSPTDEWNPEP
jgi:hypothetical protein